MTVIVIIYGRKQYRDKLDTYKQGEGRNDMATSDVPAANARTPIHSVRRAIDADLIKHVADTIVARFDPERVILFGSHARGNAGPDSDLDIFVEMETTLRPPQRTVTIGSTFGIYDWPMDIVAYTPAEVERRRQVKWSLVNTIEAEGKVLYERS